MKLKLGVIDVPEPEGGTSHSVGVELEKNYQLFSRFADYDMPNIVKDLEESIKGGLETYCITGQLPKDMFAASSAETEHRLHTFITEGTVETLGIPGVPTKAALEGRTLRTKTGKQIRKVKKGQEFKEIIGKRRASFVYSGIFEASLKVWVD